MSHRAVISAIAQLSCSQIIAICQWVGNVNWKRHNTRL